MRQTVQIQLYEPGCNVNIGVRETKKGVICRYSPRYVLQILHTRNPFFTLLVFLVFSRLMPFKIGMVSQKVEQTSEGHLNPFNPFGCNCD